MSLKQMALRHAGTCRDCGVELPAKTIAVYDFSAKNVMCLACRDAAVQRESQPDRPVELDGVGTANRRESDRRIGERRRPEESNDNSSAKITRAVHAPSSLPVG